MLDDTKLGVGQEFAHGVGRALRLLRMAKTVVRAYGRLPTRLRFALRRSVSFSADKLF
jgi:hypothetical protein